MLPSAPSAHACAWTPVGCNGKMLPSVGSTYTMLVEPQQREPGPIASRPCLVMLNDLGSVPLPFEFDTRTSIGTNGGVPAAAAPVVAMIVLSSTTVTPVAVVPAIFTVAVPAFIEPR